MDCDDFLPLRADDNVDLRTDIIYLDSLPDSLPEKKLPEKSGEKKGPEKSGDKKVPEKSAEKSNEGRNEKRRNQKEKTKPEAKSPAVKRKVSLAFAGGHVSICPAVWYAKVGDQSEHKLTNNTSKRIWFYVILKKNDGFYGIRPTSSGFLEPKSSFVIKFRRSAKGPKPEENFIWATFGLAPEDAKDAAQCYKENKEALNHLQIFIKVSKVHGKIAI